MTPFGDTTFGIRLEPDGRLFRIGLVIDGELIGDFEPAIPWTCLQQWTQLPAASDPRLDPSGSPDHLVRLLSEDEVLHHRYLSGLAESFDTWSIHAYRFGGDAVFAVERRPIEGKAQALIATVPEEAFQAIVEGALEAYGRFQSS